MWFNIQLQSSSCHGPHVSPADSVSGDVFVFVFVSLSVSPFYCDGTHRELPLLAHAPALITTPFADSSRLRHFLRWRTYTSLRWSVELSASVNLRICEFCDFLLTGFFCVCGSFLNMFGIVLDEREGRLRRGIRFLPRKSGTLLPYPCFPTDPGYPDPFPLALCTL